MLRLLNKRIKASITRPDDTDAYAAKDAIASSASAGVSVMEFAEIGRDPTGATGLIVGAWLLTSGVPATPGEYKLWLYDTAPANQNDNAAFAPSDAEQANLVGVISFTVNHDTANNRVYMADPDQLPIAFACKGTDERSLYGVLQVMNAYTPPAQEVYTVALQIDCS